MEYINEIVKKVKPFANILIFFCLFTIVFIIIAGTIKYTIPFIIGLIAASILQKPTEFIIKRFNFLCYYSFGISCWCGLFFF